MATWKKVIVSGSIASLAEVSASVGFKGSLAGNATTATTATQVGNSLTVDDSTIQLNSGTTYDGAAARTISIKDDGVTYAKIQNVSATNRILGRDSAGAGVIEEITPANLRTMINVADGANNFSLTAAGVRGLGAGIISGSTQITAAGALMDSEVTNLSFVKGLASGINEGQVLIAGGIQIVDNDFLRINGTDVEGRSASELASDIGALTNAAGIRALGAGIVSSSAQVSALGGVQNSTITVTAGNGLSGGGSFTTNTGSNGTISLAVGVDDSTIELNSDAVRVKDGGVTLAKQANMAADRIQGRANGGGAGAPQALTAAQVRTIINVEDGADVTDAAGIAALGAGIHSGSISAASITEISNLTSDEGAQLENIGTTTISATQWGYLGAMNQNVKNNSNVQFANLILTGDLTVEGTRTELQVANLNVEDQYILINSGSAGADTGIIFGGSSGTANAGNAIYWERTGAGTGNFGFVEELAHDATSADIDSKLGNIQTSTGANPTTAPTFQGVGTINVRTDDETIWIYS